MDERESSAPTLLLLPPAVRTVGGASSSARKSQEGLLDDSTAGAPVVLELGLDTDVDVVIGAGVLSFTPVVAREGVALYSEEVFWECRKSGIFSAAVGMRSGDGSDRPVRVWRVLACGAGSTARLSKRFCVSAARNI